nr:hypothetical protein [Tanacetum cinerariifolium]
MCILGWSTRVPTNLLDVRISRVAEAVVGLTCPIIWLFPPSLDKWALALGSLASSLGTGKEYLKTRISFLSGRKRVNQNALFNIENHEFITSQNATAIAIGKTLHALRHLELIGNTMSNIGLKAILDGCCHLETLDLQLLRGGLKQHMSLLLNSNAVGYFS